VLGSYRDKNVWNMSLIGLAIPAVLMGERSKQEMIPAVAFNFERTE
jgi:hypothetical protein